MINEITVNSNNAIELSRGQLLTWINDLLKLSLSKIEQLGTGTAYCQLFDSLYPGKMQLSKVNFKAKFQNEFIGNFKLLQQGFTRAGILRPIEIQKVVKCKYQDNLEFLQWFKKIFDSCGRDEAVNAHSRRDELAIVRREEIPTTRREEIFTNRREEILITRRDDVTHSRRESKHYGSSQYAQLIQVTRQDCSTPSIATTERSSEVAASKAKETIEQPIEQFLTASFEEQKQFYLKKFKEIQHLMESWAIDRPSSQLIDNIRKIILIAPAVEWSIEQGNFVSSQGNFVSSKDNSASQQDNIVEGSPVTAQQ